MSIRCVLSAPKNIGTVGIRVNIAENRAIYSGYKVFIVWAAIMQRIVSVTHQYAYRTFAMTDI